ncbi:hypothetical protein V494_03886 [Pseudogymnoascus sp. VKM F-4513 (FW-928)]|nr:hypothetical protein V494_03886 [Pseudogymnoascus sp. VKM F-4513 (FW-928)]
MPASPPPLQILTTPPSPTTPKPKIGRVYQAGGQHCVGAFPPVDAPVHPDYRYDVPVHDVLARAGHLDGLGPPRLHICTSRAQHSSHKMKRGTRIHGAFYSY